MKEDGGTVNSSEYRFTRPLERLFVDLSGAQPRSAGGAQYLV